MLAYNAANAGQAVAVQVDPVAPHLDYQYAIRSSLAPRLSPRRPSSSRRRAREGAALDFARAAFRRPDGRVAAGFPLTAATRGEPFVGTAIEDSGAAAGDRPVERGELALRTLAGRCDGLDGHAHCHRGGPASRSRYGGRRRAVWAVRLGEPRGHVGFASAIRKWCPSSDSAGEPRPAGPRMASARPSPDPRSELYTTLVDAYRLMKEGYDATRPNIIVVLTEGGGQSAGGLRREDVPAGDPEAGRPDEADRMVIIGIGVGPADADDRRPSPTSSVAASSADEPRTDPDIFLSAAAHGPAETVPAAPPGVCVRSEGLGGGLAASAPGLATAAPDLDEDRHRREDDESPMTAAGTCRSFGRERTG